jgi:hypothetical protein
MKKRSFLQEYRITRLPPDAEDEQPEGVASHALRPDGTHDGLHDLIHPDFAPQGGQIDDDTEMPEEDFGNDSDFDFNVGDDDNPNPDIYGDPAAAAAAADNTGDELPPDSKERVTDEAEPEEDQNFQGIIRTVKGACLVYKRRNEDGNYEELWIYNVGTRFDDSMQIRKAILAGTDIDTNDTQSEDGTQEATTYSIGNVQYLNIQGLPN